MHGAVSRLQPQRLQRLPTLPLHPRQLLLGMAYRSLQFGADSVLDAREIAPRDAERSADVVGQHHEDLRALLVQARNLVQERAPLHDAGDVSADCLAKGNLFAWS